VRSIIISGLVLAAATLGISTVATVASATSAPTPSPAPGPPVTPPGFAATFNGASELPAKLGAATTLAPEDVLTSVACVWAKDCVAVGFNLTANNSASGAPITALWNGSGWRAVPVPLPAGSLGAQLTSVSCEPGGCLATGTYRIAGGRDFPLAASWTGHGWTFAKPPVPAGGISAVRSAYPNAVSCASASRCVAVGEYFLAKTNAEGMFAETWNGSRWTVSAIATPAGGAATLSGITCRTATDCVAVGSLTPKGSTISGTLVEAWTGGSWTRQAAPTPAGAGLSASLEGVSCASATSCVAVGSRYTAGPSSRPTVTGFTEVRSGTTWKLHAIPVPAGRDSALGGVACTSPTRCFAAGDTMMHANHDYAYPYAAIWNGGTWSSIPVPAVPKASADFWAGGFGSVDCVSATDCVATGSEGAIHSAGSRGLTGVWIEPHWKLASFG
jgi:hypothetical protein